MKYDLVIVGAGPAGYVNSTINIELPETFGILSKVTGIKNKSVKIRLIRAIGVRI